MNHLQKIVAQLAEHADVIASEPLEKLRSIERNLQRDLAAARESDRNLRIAVIGQMKSGKSSFINATLFNQHILPKAETPMTAALTRIVYGAEPKAEVEFYSKDDWTVIERHAEEYEAAYERASAQLSEEAPASPFARPISPSHAAIVARIPANLRACAELVLRAREGGLELHKLLGQTNVIQGVGTAAQLSDALQEYVGSDGRYTAITKMSTLYLNDARLEGLEVVDTPGFNDPVVSRGAATRAHLAKCDVIFFLSPLGQFLSGADVAVLREQLPEAGLGDKAVFLVGTQQDLALRQDDKLVTKAWAAADRAPLAQRHSARLSAMMQLLERKMRGIAEETFASQIHGSHTDVRTKGLLKELQSNPPRLISAWAWLVAEHRDRLSADDHTHLERLSKATGLEFDAKRLRALAGISPMLEEILAQGGRKKELLASKEAALNSSATLTLRHCIDQIKTELSVLREQIEHGTIADLERLEQEVLTRLDAGRQRLEDVFDEHACRAGSRFALLKTELIKLANTYGRIEAVRETTSESYRVDTSIFKGLFGHTWETRYRDVVTVYASVQDAIEKIERFALECVGQFQRQIMQAVDIETLRKDLGAAAMGLFDTGSAEFDGEFLMLGINKSLRRIAVPEVSFNALSFTDEIVHQFGSGRIAEGEIEGLKKAHRLAIQAVIDTISAQVDRKINEINDSLEKSLKRFVTDMAKDITVSLHKLRAQREDKERTLKSILAASKAVDQCLR